MNEVDGKSHATTGRTCETPTYIDGDTPVACVEAGKPKDAWCSVCRETERTCEKCEPDIAFVRKVLKNFETSDDHHWRDDAWAAGHEIDKLIALAPKTRPAAQDADEGLSYWEEVREGKRLRPPSNNQTGSEHFPDCKECKPWWLCKKHFGITESDHRPSLPVSAEESAQKERERFFDKEAKSLCPDKCPITGLPLFMFIEHPKRGWVPTYGGPYVSYTIPERDSDESDEKHVRFVRESYDHDYGEWMTEDNGIESLDVVLITEDTLIDLEDAAKQPMSAEVEKAVETVRGKLRMLQVDLGLNMGLASEALDLLVAALKEKV
jgi:hypothetical protein